MTDTQKKAINGREQIMGRVRRALQVPAPKRHIPTPAPTTERFARALPVIRQEARAWLPPVGETWDEQIALFAAQCTDLRAEFFLCADLDEVRERLAALAQESNWQRIAAHPGDLTDACAPSLSLPTLVTGSGYEISELERCDAALTQCDALVAQTGSVLITSRSAGGRTLSALAPHHVVLARRKQLVPDLTAAFALLTERYGEDYPSLMSFITGPSRTGDIERILVLGAHGPKRLTIFCV
ncbi:MAG: LutC/YkgG family protein [Janthinobacterium lividum]